jgi:glycerophosphoryl diester phosphodiesterase
MVKDWLISHRGAQQCAIENTAQAFKDACKLPVSYIELDIHSTKDGVVICHHDYDINGLEIYQSTYKELKSSAPLLTTFDEAIKIIGDKKPIIIEIKPAGTAKRIIKIINKHPDWLVTSCKITIIKELIDLGFDRNKLILLQEFCSFRHIKKAKRLGVGGISVNQRLMTPRMYRRSVFKDLGVYSYTVNSRLQARLFRILYPKLKLFSDRPDLLKDIK